MTWSQLNITNHDRCGSRFEILRTHEPKGKENKYKHKGCGIGENGEQSEHNEKGDVVTPIKREIKGKALT